MNVWDVIPLAGFAFAGILAIWTLIRGLEVHRSGTSGDEDMAPTTHQQHVAEAEEWRKKAVEWERQRQALSVVAYAQRMAQYHATLAVYGALTERLEDSALWHRGEP